MIIKQTKGKDIYAVLAYALAESHAPKVIGGNIAGETVSAASQEFLATLRLKPDIQKPVLHAAFSFQPGEAVGDRLMRQLGDAFLNRMGWNLNQTQRLYIRHSDHENAGRHPHFHLIVSRIQLDGTLVSDRWDYYRGQQICRALEAEFGLTSAAAPRQLWRQPTRWESLVYAQSGVLSAKMTLQRTIFDAVQEVADRSNHLGELIDQITAAGIGVLPWRHPQTQAIEGISYRLGEFVMRGQALGAAFTWAGLQHYLGIDYDSERDAAALQRAEQSERESLQARLATGTTECSPSLFRQQVDFPGRSLLPSRHPDDRSNQRRAFITRNFQLLASGLGLEERAHQREETSLATGLGIPDSPSQPPERVPHLPTLDRPDPGAIRPEAEALSHRDRPVAGHPPNHDRSVGVAGSGGDRSGRIYAGTLELRNRLAALLRGRTHLSKPANDADPAAAPDLAQPIGAGLGSSRGSSASRSPGAANSSDSQRTTDSDPGTLDSGAARPQAPAAAPGSIAQPNQRRIQPIIGYSRTFSDAASGIEQPDRPEHHPRSHDRPTTPAEDDRNATQASPTPLPIANPPRPRIQPIAGSANDRAAPADRPGSGRDRRTQSPASDSADSGSGEWNRETVSDPADQGYPATGDGWVDSAGNLSQSGGSPDADRPRSGGEPTIPARQRPDRGSHQTAGVAQAPGQFAAAVARPGDPVDADLRGANHAGASDQRESPIATDGDRSIDQTGNRSDPATQGHESDASGCRGGNEAIEPTHQNPEVAEPWRLQLDGDRHRSDGSSHSGKSDPLPLRHPLHEANFTNPNRSAASPNDTRETVTYAQLYDRYSPHSGDPIQDDFTIATTALSNQHPLTEVACILTVSPLVQQHKHNRAGVQSYIESIIADATLQQQLHHQSGPVL